MNRSGVMRIRAAALAAVSLVCLASCAPSIAVKRRSTEAMSLTRVGVLLFDDGGVAPLRQAEEITEIFSLEMRRFFPDLVERFEIEEALAKTGEAMPTTLSPQRARELGERFQCDAFFVGRVTALKDKPSLFPVNGGHQFGLTVWLVSSRTGEVMLASKVDSEGTFLMPLDTSKEISIYSVKKLVARLGFEEKRAIRLDRNSPLWLAAMRAYEERRFWDAARLFGEAISQYPVSVLTEEAYLYMGRSFAELSLAHAAERAWTALAELFPASEFHAPAIAERAALAYREGRRAAGDSLAAALAKAHGKDPSRHLVAYAAGIAAKAASQPERALALLATVPIGADYGPHAQYAQAECFLALGREEDALAALEHASVGDGRSRGHEALAARAWIALGRRRLLRGDADGALAAFSRVAPADDADGRAALGTAWVALGKSDAAGARDAIAQAPPLSGIDRAEAGLLQAVALDGLGDREGAVASLRQAARDIESLRESAGAVARARATAELARASIGELEESAWQTALRRPSAERETEAGRIGSRQSALAGDLSRANTQLAAALEAKAEEARLAAMAERGELLLANLLLAKTRPSGERAARPPVSTAAAISRAWSTSGTAEPAGTLTRRDGSRISGDVVSLALSDIGFRPTGSPAVLLVPRAEVHRIDYEDGRDVAGGALHSEHKDLGLRAAYLREVTRKPYLLETELQISRRDVAERSILRGFIVASAATLFTHGDSKFLVFPAVFVGQFTLAYLAGF